MLKSNLKTRLQDCIAELDPEDLDPLLDTLAQAPIHVVRGPAAGLVMMSVRDCFDTPFHMGEVLVTEAEVDWEGRPGYGCCMGDNPAGAMVLACLDALKPENIATVESLCSSVETLCQNVHKTRERDSKLSALTRVEFQSMAEES